MNYLISFKTQSEQKVIGYYKKCSSMSRGQCIVKYKNKLSFSIWWFSYNALNLNEAIYLLLRSWVITVFITMKLKWDFSVHSNFSITELTETLFVCLKKDKTNIKWNLGVSYRGIGLYEANNRVVTKKVRTKSFFSRCVWYQIEFVS